MAQPGIKEIDIERASYAINKLSKLGFNPKIVSSDNERIELNFIYKNNEIKLFPYTGWFQGKAIVANRGIHKLIKQLK